MGTSKADATTRIQTIGLTPWAVVIDVGLLLSPTWTGR
jgi:hypothetical protein